MVWTGTANFRRASMLEPAGPAALLRHSLLSAVTTGLDTVRANSPAVRLEAP